MTFGDRLFIWSSLTNSSLMHRFLKSEGDCHVQVIGHVFEMRLLLFLITPLMIWWNYPAVKGASLSKDVNCLRLLLVILIIVAITGYLTAHIMYSLSLISILCPQWVSLKHIYMRCCTRPVGILFPADTSTLMIWTLFFFSSNVLVVFYLILLELLWRPVVVVILWDCFIEIVNFITESFL